MLAQTIILPNLSGQTDIQQCRGVSVISLNQGRPRVGRYPADQNSRLEYVMERFGLIPRWLIRNWTSSTSHVASFGCELASGDILPGFVFLDVGAWWVKGGAPATWWRGLDESGSVGCKRYPCRVRQFSDSFDELVQNEEGHFRGVTNRLYLAMILITKLSTNIGKVDAAEGNVRRRCRLTLL
ncbi:hypothetical protein CC78DRAFT_579997 [Lojkania enalia]|uniref:Uncharacterized protein n=1 Tax=Lojkania enalia TaxID=147567 RepID=A0A9P4K8W4_9PLEO|nr:hypothetical protein CC78DRAFT_579997 [Didymosphaeria enalia]